MSDVEDGGFAGPTKAQLEAQRAEELRVLAEEAKIEASDEDDTQEEDDEQHAEQEAEPASRALSERDIERISKRIDQAVVANEKRLHSIMGDDFDNLAPCPLCAVPGFAYKPGLIVIEPLHRAAIMAAIGEDAEPEYRPDPKTKACPACDGLGDVLTGSKRDAASKKGCDSCGGTGWVPKLDPQTGNYSSGSNITVGSFGGSVLNVPPTTLDNGNPYPGYGIAFIPVPNGSPDGFNRPAGHPHYGMPREYSEQVG